MYSIVYHLAVREDKQRKHVRFLSLTDAHNVSWRHVRKFFANALVAEETESFLQEFRGEEGVAEQGAICDTICTKTNCVSQTFLTSRDIYYRGDSQATTSSIQDRLFLVQFKPSVKTRNSIFLTKDL